MGYYLDLDPPSAQRTAISLRQAIWPLFRSRRKEPFEFLEAGMRLQARIGGITNFWHRLLENAGL